MAKSPAWQRAEGKNPEGGLNAKGRAAYNRANPGKPGLKAPQPEGGPRRDSFCARMKGMKRKLTSAKTANDPNSRINKSLRAWNCAEGGMIKKYAKGGGISTEMGKGKSVDLRMAQMDKYLKDPDMELVIGPTGKFQFRERKSSVPAAPTPKKPKPNPNAVAGAGTGNKTPRGGGISPVLPLSAFSSSGKRQAARPLDTPTRVTPPAVQGRDDYSSPRAKRNMGIAKAALATVAPLGLGRGVTAGRTARATSEAPKYSEYTKALEANRAGQITTREAMEQMGMPFTGRGNPRAAANAQRAKEALRGRNVTAEEAADMALGFKLGGITKAKPTKVATVMREFRAGKLRSGKSKQNVKNPKQAVAIALSEGRKATRKS